MKLKKKNSTLKSQERREKFQRRLKFYSTAAGLGAFACSSAAQGAITLFDIPDVTITNNNSGVPQFINIDAGADGSIDWQILAPGFANQIRIDTVFNPFTGVPNHSDIGNAPAGPGPVLVGQGNQLLSGHITGPVPGYYVQSVPAGTMISRATMAPSFYAGVAAHDVGSIVYNHVGTCGYVGLEWAFNGSGSTDRRYGWAQINVTPVNGQPAGFLSATLTAYAIQMTPNTPIAAAELENGVHVCTIPEPSSLVLLAAGGGGLALAARRRRRRRA